MTGVAAVILVWLLAQVTIAPLLSDQIGRIGEQARTATTVGGAGVPIQSVASDVCAMLTSTNPLRQWLAWFAFPSAASDADRLRSRYRFSPLEPCRRGRNNVITAQPTGARG